MTEVEYKLMWARTYLKNYGAVENSKQGVWVLTTKGVALAKQENLDIKEIIRFTNNKNSTTKDLDSDFDSFTESKSWREQITDILLNMNPYAFEKLAQRLLRECGFSDVEVTKKLATVALMVLENYESMVFSVSMWPFNVKDIKVLWGRLK